MKYRSKLMRDISFEPTPSLARSCPHIPSRLRQFGAIAATVALLGGTSTALADTPFFIGPLNNGDSTLIAPAEGDALQIFTTSASSLVDGMEIDLTLPSGSAVTGTVKRRLTDLLKSNASTELSGNEYIVISFEDGAGALSVYAQDDQIVGFELFDSSTVSYFSAAVDSSGSGVLAREDAETMHCVSMPIDFSATVEPSEAELADVPDLDGLFNLESRPGATNVVYIDYDGGVTSGTGWNDRYTGGADIVYEPFSGDFDTSSFSEYDQYLMYVGWLEMAEDYAPFDVNITTKLSVYESTARTNRSRLNATPTNSWVGNFGGIAYVNVFGRSTDYFTIGWTFNATPGSLGQTHSHEAGHQMGLSHDGLLSPRTTYYRGHGRWGPIMGAPFGQEYVQWSKGDYSSADRSENDLVIIDGKLTTLADDVGNTEADAQSLAPPVFGVMGQITPDGLFSDVDVYTFTLNVDNAEATVEVSTILGAEQESFGANAALNATLSDSFGTVVASMTSSDITPLSPFTNKLEFTGPLDAGTYFLEIDAVSPDSDPSSGFNEYGNGGQYLVTVDAEVGAGGPPQIVAPIPGSEIASVSEIFKWTYSELEDTDFWLYLGSNLGGNDIINTGNLGPSGNYDTAVSGEELPLDGRTIYARLWYRDSDAPTDNTVPWEFIDVSYTTVNTEGAIVITSPSNTEELPGTTVTFEYEDQNGSTDSWWLYAGSALGTQDYFNSGLVEPLSRSDVSATVLGETVVEGLPADGSTVFIRLWHREKGSPWEYVDATYTASTNSFVSFASPVAGSTLSGAEATFEFQDDSTSVAEWWLYLGSSVGQLDYYNSLNLGSTAQASATNLPVSGETIYARLWYRLPNQGRWQFIDEVFQAADLESASLSQRY